MPAGNDRTFIPSGAPPATARKKGPRRAPSHAMNAPVYWPGQTFCSSWLKLNSFLTEVFRGAPK